jgi:hypothetical protein
VFYATFLCMKASIGGILGLGLGFSIISAIELCYFVCCSWCFRKRRRMSESTDNNWALENAKFPGKHKRLEQSGKKPTSPVTVKFNPIIAKYSLNIHFILIQYAGYPGGTEKNFDQHLGQYYLQLIFSPIMPYFTRFSISMIKLKRGNKLSDTNSMCNLFSLRS